MRHASWAAWVFTQLGPTGRSKDQTTLWNFLQLEVSPESGAVLTRIFASCRPELLTPWWSDSALTTWPGQGIPKLHSKPDSKAYKAAGASMIVTETFRTMCLSQSHCFLNEGCWKNRRGGSLL